MPTPNRLAQSTLPADPSQTGKGVQVYWLSCLPCHGDRGQGLTEEESWQVTAFLLRENNLWNAQGKLTASNGDLILVSAPLASATPQPPPTALPFLFIIGFIVVVFILIFRISMRKHRS